MKGQEFTGKVSQPIGIIGVFTSTSNRQHEIIPVIAGTLTDNGRPHLQALQEICGGLLPFVPADFSECPSNRHPWSLLVVEERCLSLEAIGVDPDKSVNSLTQNPKKNHERDKADKLANSVSEV